MGCVAVLPSPQGLSSAAAAAAAAQRMHRLATLPPPAAPPRAAYLVPLSLAFDSMEGPHSYTWFTYANIVGSEWWAAHAWSYASARGVQLRPRLTAAA